jgi:RNA polymerase-binding transcription factor DksA
MKKTWKSPFPISLLEPLRNFLTKEEKKLAARKATLDKEDPFTNTDRLNDNAAVDTDAAEEFGHERVVAMKMEIDKGIIRIRKTLTRIKLGKYGICDKCRKMIDTDRLAINPTASLCIKCQSGQKD